MKKISILIYCYNECENIEPLYQSTCDTIASLSEYEWEMVFCDNFSTDGTRDILREIAFRDKRVKVILNQANYGAGSIANGLFSICADAVISMASDFEEPPELISDFVVSWENGYKVVLAKYTARKENVLIRLCRKAYYKIITSLSEYNLESNVTGFGLFDMEVIDVIREMGEYQVYLRYLCAELGYSIKYVPFNKPKRKSGKSSYSFIGYCKVAAETVVMTSDAPLHVASFLGFIISMGSVLTAFVFLAEKLVMWSTFDWGIAPIMVGLFFLGGLQLFFIGIIGEYLLGVIKRLTKRPYAIESERINFDNYGRPGRPERSLMENLK